MKRRLGCNFCTGVRKAGLCATAAGLLLHAGLFSGPLLASSTEVPAAKHFHERVQPLLNKYCSDCHEDGANKGGVAFDELGSDQELLTHTDLWFKVLKNVRAGLMPPQKKARPASGEREQLEHWIIFDEFGLDPRNIDPGKVTVRRLNRTEYRNTIRDLMGVDFNTDVEFPPDDSGYGFDNIADVLTVSPMLLEKYLAAAKKIVSEAVPSTGRAVAERVVPGDQFRGSGEKLSTADGRLSLSYYEASRATNSVRARYAGHYVLVLEMSANEKLVDDQFDYNRCRMVFRVDGEELLREEYGREAGKSFHYEVPVIWEPGEHQLALEVEPLTPDQKQVRSLTLRLMTVTLRGPLEEQYWEKPRNYDRFFKTEPKTEAEKHAEANALLRDFAGRAFRRPVDAQTLARLVKLAEDVYKQPGKAFEAGIAHAMLAVLASPRFLFREERAQPQSGAGYPLLDEYSLASRLSYFLWSSMPDPELMRLAAAGELRKNLKPQVERMLADHRSRAFIRNFTGQWLEARDIESIPIDARAVLLREQKVDPDLDKKRARYRELRNRHEETLTPAEKEEMAKLRADFFKRFGNGTRELTGELRQAMRQETEKYFEHVMREDRSIVEFIESDYTYLNERLAKHYGISGVTGDEMRLVKLPSESPRGGILTQGTVLAVTSNPTRTSPVKRGLFILDNVLGMPPPPPPPNIPPLEDAARDIKGREPTLRETLEMHRSKPLCSSCHNRMDPLGLALENFNAMGMWRGAERDQPIDSAGKLITGEEFSNIRQLKHIIATNHRREFYRCITEKLLTYALGRGLDYRDVLTVDQIVERLEKDDGRFSALLFGVIESNPFQKCRGSGMLAQSKN